MNSQEVAAPLVLSSPREKPLDHRTPLHTSRNGGSNHGEYVMPPANKQLESAVTHNQTGHVMDSNPLDHAPMGLVARASSVDHFATVPRLTTTLKKTMTVRALFDYDPLTDTGLPSRGLPFHHGDILHVVNASDREWWQARKVTLMPTAAISALSGHDSTSDSISSSVIGQSPLGIIPSCERIERRHRIRSKRVNFFTKVTVIGGGCLHGPPTGTPGMTSTTITSGNALNHSSALPLHPPLTARASASGPGLSSQTRTPVNGTNGEGQSVLPSNSATLERSNAVSDTVDGEKKMRSNSLTLNLFKRFSGRGRRKENSISLSGSVHSTPMDMAYEAELGVVRSYEVMTPISISLTRPLLVFGPLKERVIDVLLQDPKFTSCVPHTSRPPRAGEVNGVDYHFVGSKTQMEELIRADRFIEVGQFQDHYYATSVDSVCQVLLSGRVCVLNVNLTAIKRLEHEGLYPISVLLKPISALHLRTIQRRLTEDQAKRSIDLALRLEADNWRLFSTIVVFDTIENAVSSIQRFVQLHNGPVIWVPSHCPLPRFSRGPIAPLGSQSSTLPRATPPILPTTVR